MVGKYTDGRGKYTLPKNRAHPRSFEKMFELDFEESNWTMPARPSFYISMALNFSDEKIRFHQHSQREHHISLEISGCSVMFIDKYLQP